MLGKLLKYDFKEAKLLLTAYALSLGSSLISFILFICGSFESQNGFIVILSGAQFLFTLLTLFGVLIASMVIIVVNFGKHTVGAQGQMMLTLPVSIDQFLASKLISAFVISVSSMVYFFAWMVGVFVSVGEFTELTMIFTQISTQIFTVNYALLIMLGFLASIIMFYTSIALSGRFSSNRVLGSVVAYLCINFIVQVVTIIVFLVGGVSIFSLANDGMISDPMTLLNTISLIIYVLYGILIIAGYLITRNEFSKKINLP